MTTAEPKLVTVHALAQAVAARVSGHYSVDSLRQWLRRHPDVDATIPRVGGNRAFSPATVERVVEIIARDLAAKAAG